MHYIIKYFNLQIYVLLLPAELGYKVHNIKICIYCTATKLKQYKSNINYKKGNKNNTLIQHSVSEILEAKPSYQQV